MGTRLSWALFPLLSTTLFLIDTTTSFCYAIYLFVYADRYSVKEYELPYNTWGAFIIVITFVSSFIINIITVLDRYDLSTLGTKQKVQKVLLCFVPHLYVIKACYRHMTGTLSDTLTLIETEWAGFTRLLQGLSESVPQLILQGYLVSFEVLRKGSTEYPSWVPVVSLSVCIINAAFGFTFYVVNKYYSQEMEKPLVWQRVCVALAAIFLLGGRGLAVGLMGSSWDMLWLALLGLVTIFLLVFVYWTAKVRGRRGGPFYNLNTRFTLSLMETFAVAVPLKWTIIVTVPYLSLSVAFAIQRHQDPLDWVFFSVPVVAQIIGLLLVLICRDVYRKAYSVLTFSVLPPKPEVIQPKTFD
ncbi:hypothetical protein Pcinc_027086 [Petrolisthes cinctipes]|uniref:XK-related protein n=1 Tax=Petrolisthes cinctipes TaxID=88211 RepID=A0AAE1F662_PETCI|nr:hypothetical protein Pcinc_027086 [Petrolisthes cinctipes]